MTPDESVSRLHYELIRGLITRGVCPTRAELADEMRTSAAEVEALLRALADIHGVVLHPHVCEPWIVHPFSITPSSHWIESGRGGWWAPCTWCALGLAALVGGEVRIHARFGGEAEPLIIPVADGRPVGLDNVRVHFAIPPVRAWDNVHLHCSLVLPFRSEADVAKWCGRHRLPQGQVVPLRQVAALAQIWYGRHADRMWQKWTVSEAQEIFHRAGLSSDFWDLGAKTGRF